MVDRFKQNAQIPFSYIELPKQIIPIFGPVHYFLKNYHEPSLPNHSLEFEKRITHYYDFMILGAWNLLIALSFYGGAKLLESILK